MLYLNKVKKVAQFIFCLSLVFIVAFLSPKNAASQTVLFQDNFDDGNYDGWVYYGAPGWSIKAGEYGINIPGRSTISNSYPEDALWDFSQKNIRFEVDLRGVYGTDKNILIKYKNPSNFLELHHSGDYIYIDKKSDTKGIENLGKFYYPLANGSVYHFSFEIQDLEIKIFIDGTHVFTTTDTLPEFDNWKIGLRAGTGADFPTQVYFDNVLVQTLAEDVPTSKIVFIPGFGGSWNADAILNCQPDNNPENWSLAPFAEEVYNSLLSAFSQTDFTVLPFYYDWRQWVPANSAHVVSLIANNTEDGEKVHLIGHSMGGLVGRKYLENEGPSNRLDKFMTVGTPHQGSILSYPAWSAGKTWNDNFIQKVATSLLLKRCGGVVSDNRENIREFIPSVQNLLPTVDFLRDKKTNILKDVSTMSAQNNLIAPPNSNMFDFHGVTVGSLSGTGYETLSEIMTKSRNPHDEKLGNWEDGKATGKIFSLDGDGTVLASSSEIIDADNRVLIDTHSGLVANNQGISQIFDFFSLPSPILLPSLYQDPQTALIVISHPSDFWVMDSSGKISKGKNGILSIKNPKSGNFKLGIIPDEEETLVMVGQLLKNGEIHWKEYTLSGKLPKLKNINFDSNTVNEDPLN